MILLRRSAGIFLAAIFFMSAASNGQEVRRAQPLAEPPVPRALPADNTPPPSEDSTGTMEEKPSTPEQPSDKRQLDYANALFSRKMYDLAVPEYQKYLSDYPGGPGRANAYFGLGESYRLLGKSGSAHINFQKVIDDYGESEFAGPAAYALSLPNILRRAASKARSEQTTPLGCTCKSQKPRANTATTPARPQVRCFLPAANGRRR
ncbi:MAG: hypothetical protein DMF03_04235 [Verrucomicrobia bacterium]|nr:MAG: hypothetical protein DMF03_04235 [Verrucomicrobiota bacterium]